MNLDQLRTFLWVARLGGVRRASEQMNVSQPAVSARLQALEDSLRVRLLDRTTRGVSLTREGELLRGYAEQMFFVQQEILQRVADRSGATGLFRVGASETVAESWLPQFLKRLSAEFPRLDLELTVDISVNLREALLARQLDLAFLMGPISEFSVANTDLPEFALGWYRAAGTETADFLSSPVISYARNTRPYRELVAELGKRYGPKVRIYSCASLSASMQMIASGIGVGPVPIALARERVAAGQLERFDPGWTPAPLRFTASWVADPHNSLAERCAELAQAVAEDW
ncbi:LysR family transcriptional regulator [Pararhodobacter sp. SW119]|uniref:LysR family transcriptional regulator n=1 Tax=Pararhodobacter sp. SW119 TaxID=2780075 RepID=UPI001ADED065|nr:LysR family transcriptional regulator [Pararhodobacter sp. SW119]